MKTMPIDSRLHRLPNKMGHISISEDRSYDTETKHCGKERNNSF